MNMFIEISLLLYFSELKIDDFFQEHMLLSMFFSRNEKTAFA
jgi:hypothetical protein